ncbi:MAG: CIA30 family protein [Pseudomonadota bacterium]
MVTALTLSLAMLAGASMSMSDYLDRAISRGVPLYNNGQPAACAAVYATALEGIAASDDWGLPDKQRRNLAQQLELTAGLASPDDQAWAYRRLIDALMVGEPIMAPATAEPRALFDFSDPGEVRRFRVVLDGVMGGLSTGRVTQEADALVFTGETSLRNNGGFSSIRALVPAGTMAGYDALRIRVKGDGRTWILGATGNPGRRGSSFWQRFDTDEGEWMTVTVPINEMVRQYFGTPIQGSLRPSGVRGVEFYIYDKKAGPFRLEVAGIEAVRAGAS